jgi:UrcA family protein
MNIKKQYSPSLKHPTVKAALIALCAIAPIVSAAETPPETAPESISARVSPRDVNLTTPEGQRAAHERLLQTTRHLCSSLEARHPQSLAHDPMYIMYPMYIRCVDETLARALQQVSGPALAATQKSSGPALAATQKSSGQNKY